MAAQEGSSDAHALAVSLLHDLLRLCTFMASHPLHLAYLLFFSPYILSLLAFFSPLLVSTSLLLLALITAAPFLGRSPERSALRFLGTTCGAALGALCAELRPDGTADAGLLGQLCAFVLPPDAAVVLRVGEAMGEWFDTSSCCSALEAKSSVHEILEEIEDGGIQEKVVECDVLVQIKQCELPESHGQDLETQTPDAALVLELGEAMGELFDTSSCWFALEAKSSVHEILLEIADGGIEEKVIECEDIKESKDVVEEKRLECDVLVQIEQCEPPESHGQELEAQTPDIEYEAFKDAKESVQDGEEAQEYYQEESSEHKTFHEFHGKYSDKRSELDAEEHKGDVQEPVVCNGNADSPMSTCIARRVHSRSSSENLLSEASPRREKEWKRTLACKLYEERMQLKLCKDRAIVETGEDMDMLWEAYEVSGGNAKDDKCSRERARGTRIQDKEEEEEEEEEDEGHVKQLCCLQALKFSTRKMHKPNMAKISKVLRRMTVFSTVGSRRDRKG